MPPKLQARIADFGVLSEDSVRDYTTALTSSRIAAACADSEDDSADFDVDSVRALPQSLTSPRARSWLTVNTPMYAEAIAVAHNYVRGELGECSVSQRDIQRVFKAWDFFLGHRHARAARERMLTGRGWCRCCSGALALFFTDRCTASACFCALL